MNAAVPELLRAAARVLRERVAPELRSDLARGQLAAVLDVLGKLERMTDWSSAIVDEEQAALDALAAQVETCLVGAGLAASPDPAGPGAVPVERARERVRALIDRAFDAVPPGDLRERVDGLLRDGLRDAVAAERRHVPRMDFSAMTGSKED